MSNSDTVDKQALNEAYGKAGEAPEEVTDGQLEAAEITPHDVLIMLCVNQLDSKQPVDVVATLSSLGMEDIIEAAKISLEAEEEEDGDVPDDQEPEADDEPGDAALADELE